MSSRHGTNDANRVRKPLAGRHANASRSSNSVSRKTGKNTESARPRHPETETTTDTKAEKPEVNHVTLKFKVRDIYKSKSDMIIREKRRDEAFHRFVSGRKARSVFMTSYMPDTNPETTEEREPEEFSLDYMNTLNIPAFGNTHRMYVQVKIGQGEQAATADLLVDTGSSAIWVNSRVFRRVNKVSAKIIANTSFEVTYGEDKSIRGDLYKGTITFAGTRVSVKDQKFGVIDEGKNPNARTWWEEEGIEGILGIGPRRLNEGIAKRFPDGRIIELPTIIDSMKDQDLISNTQVGIFCELPDEENGHQKDTASISADSSIGMMTGKLHLGAPDWRVCDVSTLKWVPASAEGEVRHYFGVDFKLAYDGETIMKPSSGIIDTGSRFISLPESVLNKYAEAIHRASGQEEPVVKYDKKSGLYHIAKDDIKYLRDMKFDFVKHSDAAFKFSPQAQIIPPSFTHDWLDSSEKDRIFLVFRKLDDDRIEPWNFKLGLHWSMWYYLVLRSLGETKSIGIADIAGRMEHGWRELENERPDL